MDNVYTRATQDADLQCGSWNSMSSLQVFFYIHTLHEAHVS